MVAFVPREATFRCVRTICQAEGRRASGSRAHHRTIQALLAHASQPERSEARPATAGRALRLCQLRATRCRAMSSLAGIDQARLAGGVHPRTVARSKRLGLTPERVRLGLRMTGQWLSVWLGSSPPVGPPRSAGRRRPRKFQADGGGQAQAERPSSPGWSPPRSRVSGRGRNGNARLGTGRCKASFSCDGWQPSPTSASAPASAGPRPERGS